MLIATTKRDTGAAIVVNTAKMVYAEAESLDDDRVVTNVFYESGWVYLDVHWEDFVEASVPS